MHKKRKVDFARFEYCRSLLSPTVSSLLKAQITKKDRKNASFGIRKVGNTQAEIKDWCPLQALVRDELYVFIFGLFATYNQTQLL